MSTTTIKKFLAGITIDPNMPYFSKSPSVIRAVERAKAKIARIGLPKELTNPKKK